MSLIQNALEKAGRRAGPSLVSAAPSLAKGAEGGRRAGPSLVPAAPYSPIGGECGRVDSTAQTETDTKSGGGRPVVPAESAAPEKTAAKPLAAVKRILTLPLPKFSHIGKALGLSHNSQRAEVEGTHGAAPAAGARRAVPLRNANDRDARAPLAPAPAIPTPPAASSKTVEVPVKKGTEFDTASLPPQDKDNSVGAGLLFFGFIFGLLLLNLLLPAGRLPVEATRRVAPASAGRYAKKNRPAQVHTRMEMTGVGLVPRFTSEPELHLTGITSSGSGRLALINDQVAAAGDRLREKAVVQEITEHEVLLEYQGRKIKLTL